jgi:hypothetical protein
MESADNLKNVYQIHHEKSINAVSLASFGVQALLKKYMLPRPAGQNEKSGEWPQNHVWLDGP